MKTIKYFFFVAVSTILAAGCSNKDSEFYNDVFVSFPNLVSVDFGADQILYVNADIPRYIDEQGQATKLDIFKSTGDANGTNGATRLDFSYELERTTDAINWSLVEISQSQLIVVKGAALPDSFVFGSSVYNDANKIYEYRVGIHSLLPGDYRLSFGYNSTNTTDVEFRSASINNNLFLNLNSAYPILDGGGFYYFTIL